MSNRNRTAGHNYERKIVNELKALGYDVSTTRSTNRELDNQKVDIWGTFPYYIQCKITQNNPDYNDIIKNTEAKDKPLVIFHNKTEKVKSNIVTQGEYVIMKKSVFYSLIGSQEDLRNEIIEELKQRILNAIN